MQDTEAWILGTSEPPAERLRQFGAAGVRRLMFSMVALLGARVTPLVREGA